MSFWIVCLAAVVACSLTSLAADMPTGRDHTNSVGMRMARIGAGAFTMGTGETPLSLEVAGKPWRRLGDFDERPAHRVRITVPFYMGVHEVTNAQYEQYDPAHRSLRGKLGFSKADDEAVVFVTWHDAARFCEWLSGKEGVPYRLPTEAEWEYACRAGTSSPFHTGDTLPEAFLKNVRESWFPDPALSRKGDVVPLTVGQTPPNAWGLFDMHGNVEEWCHDWYGPYEAEEQADPVGRRDGDFRVTRGGSHSTAVYYLRSSNRSGTLPEDRSWLVGFRVVLGQMPKTNALPMPAPQRYQRNVERRALSRVTQGPDPAKPYFKGPRKYVKIPLSTYGPMFASHNHDPALVECPNGDLLAIWYSCVEEAGRELGILASCLRWGAVEWEPASLFWDAPDRNDHAPALWFDGRDTICHFNGLSACATWGNLATIMRTSSDSGVTWSKARIINPEHSTRHMPVESVFQTQEGYIVLPCDAVTGGQGGTAIHISRDHGQTWTDAGGKTAGIHAGVVQLRDGRLMALGRGDNIDGKMPKSVSMDMGKTWTYSASEFPPIGGGQRLALLGLREGPLLLASFAKQMTITDATGTQRPVSGLFAALSFDEGETWPARRLVTDDGPDHLVDGTDGRRFVMSGCRSEPRGYLSVCQARNGIIHLISSRQHYAFNLAWLKTAAPAGPSLPPPPSARDLPLMRDLPKVYDASASALPTQASERWRFTGSGVAEADAVSFPLPGLMKIDTGRGQRCRWADDSKKGFAVADEAKGFTAEIAVRVLKSTASGRGIDFEAYTGDGSSGGHRYFISVMTERVCWYGDEVEAIAEGMDNHSAVHVYRLAVREDHVAHVYRDEQLLAVRRGVHSADGMLRPRGPYLQWGEGAGGSEADALVAHVAYDLSGPWGP